MSSCIKEGNTAKGRQCSKYGAWMQNESGFKHVQELLLCIGVHGGEMAPVPFSSSLHRSRDSSCPRIKPASRISKAGSTIFAPLMHAALGTCCIFPIMTNAHKETGTTERLHNPHQLKRRKPDTPIPSSALEAQKD